MAMIVPKVQKMNDDNSQRAMVMVRHSLQPSAIGSKLWSYSKGKHLEVFFMIFDLANEKILFQQQIKNELQPGENMSRYNLQHYVTMEQSAETVVTNNHAG